MSTLDWESAFGRLLLDDSFRLLAREIGAAAYAHYDLDAAEKAILLEFNHLDLDRFALNLKHKRLLRLRSALPTTFRALGADQDLVVGRYLSAHPTVPASCSTEVRAFGDVILRHVSNDAVGGEWRRELARFEIGGHLRCCADAIDAEGVVSRHVVVSTDATEERDDYSEFVDLRQVVACPAPTVWEETYLVDVVTIATWVSENPVGARPPASVLSPGRYLVIARPELGRPMPRAITLSPPLDHLWQQLDGTTNLATLVERVSQATLPRDAWAGMLHHLAQQKFIVMRDAPSRRHLPRIHFGDVKTSSRERRQVQLRLPARSWDDGTSGAPVRTRFGIGLRRPYLKYLLDTGTESIDPADCLEVYGDEYARPDASSADELARLRARYLLIPHGLELSLGSATPPDPDYVSRLAALIHSIGAPYYTEHLAWTHTREWRLGHLCPCRLDDVALERITGRVGRIQDTLRVPLAVENISYEMLLPGGGIAEADFLARLCERTGCGLLVDVTNVRVNAENHNFDAFAFLDRLPLDRVLQLHLVGYTRDARGMLIDGHAETTQSDILELARHLIERGARPHAVILERDRSLPALPDLLREVGAIRAALTADTRRERAGTE